MNSGSFKTLTTNDGFSREKWWERVGDIIVSGMTSWWWWYVLTFNSPIHNCYCFRKIALNIGHSIIVGYKGYNLFFPNTISIEHQLRVKKNYLSVFIQTWYFLHCIKCQNLFRLFSLFNSILVFVGYLMPNSSFRKKVRVQFNPQLDG